MAALRQRFSELTIAFVAAGIIATAPAQAQSFNFGGMVGGIVQGAIQSDLQRQQIELQRQRIELERQRQLQYQHSLPPTFLPTSVSNDLPEAGTAPDVTQGLPLGSAHEARPYRVDGVVLGNIATPKMLSEGFKCYSSEQFAGFRWCSRGRTEKGVFVQTAMLAAPDNSIGFYAKYYASARFETGAIRDQMDRLSARYHEQGRLLPMPGTVDGADGIIALWGGITLTPVDAATYRDLASGKKVTSGLFIDYLSNSRDSAKRGLPVYRIAGGAGYFWVARSDPDGGGTLRFGIADASAYQRSKAMPVPPVVAQAEPARTTNAGSAMAKVGETPENLAPVSNQAATPASARPAATAEKSAASPIVPILPAPAASLVQSDQDKRVALVIGNSAYRSVSMLANPSADAEAVAGTLRSEGFSVKLVEDVTLQQLKDAMRDFQVQADEADWAMVYYAGHGIEISGQNYLIPVDARLKTDQDADDEAVTLRYVLDKMHNARKLRLVILDACRQNPFQSAMKRQLAGRAVARGLAPYEPRVANEMVVYAAKDGEQAQDGSSAGHSPFAKALIARMAMPGIEINKVFRLVTADVLADTGNQQQPFIYGSTPGVEDFYFKTR